MARIFTQTFGVTGAIIEKEGKILLVKESEIQGSDAGKWNHPAGWIEVGESPIESVKKEVKEETGYQFTPENVLGIYSLLRKDFLRAGEEVRHPIKVIFTGAISEKKIRELADDISEIRWFKPKEIEEMNAHTLRDLDIKKMVRDYFKGQRYPLDIITHTVSE